VAIVCAFSFQDVTEGPLLCYILYLLLVSIAMQQTHSSAHHTLSLPYKYNAQDANSHTEPTEIQRESNI